MRASKEQGRGDKVHSDTIKLMSRLQREFGVKCYFFLNFDGWKMEEAILRYAKRYDLDIKLLKHMNNEEFNDKMASPLLFFEEYPCPAFSRATVVSAAVGTPQISTDMNEPSTMCFPDLTVPHGDMKKVYQLAKRLITDKDFWQEQSDAGVKNCEYYYYPALKERILNLYNKLRKNRSN